MFSEDDLYLIHAALGQYAAARRAEDVRFNATRPDPRADMADALARRVVRCMEPDDAPRYGRGDREDFHADG